MLSLFAERFLFYDLSLIDVTEKGNIFFFAIIHNYCRALLVFLYGLQARNPSNGFWESKIISAWPRQKRKSKCLGISSLTIFYDLHRAGTKYTKCQHNFMLCMNMEWFLVNDRRYYVNCQFVLLLKQTNYYYCFTACIRLLNCEGRRRQTNIGKHSNDLFSLHRVNLFSSS